MSSERMFLKLHRSVFVISTVISLSSLQTRGAIIGTIWAEAVGKAQVATEKDQAEKHAEMLKSKRDALKEEIFVKFHTAMDLIKSTRGVVPEDETNVFACIEKFGKDNIATIERIEQIEATQDSAEGALTKLKAAYDILLALYKKTEPFFKNVNNLKSWKTAIDEIKGEEDIMAIKAIIDNMADKDQAAIRLTTKRLTGFAIYEGLLEDLKKQEDKKKPPMIAERNFGLITTISRIGLAVGMSAFGAGIPLIVAAAGGAPGIVVTVIGGLLIFLDAPRPNQAGKSLPEWSDLDSSVAQLFQIHLAAKCPSKDIISFVDFTMEDLMEFVKEFNVDEDQQETLIDLIGLSE